MLLEGLFLWSLFLGWVHGQAFRSNRNKGSAYVDLRFGAHMSLQRGHCMSVSQVGVCIQYTNCHHAHITWHPRGPGSRLSVSINRLFPPRLLAHQDTGRCLWPDVPLSTRSSSHPYFCIALVQSEPAKSCACVLSTLVPLLVSGASTSVPNKDYDPYRVNSRPVWP